jgi:hypothetical protein
MTDYHRHPTQFSGKKKKITLTTGTGPRGVNIKVIADKSQE